MRNERRKIGILFNFSPHWMGGVIYIINIVKMLNYLDDEEKPEVYLFYRADLKKFVSEIHYPFLKNIEWPFPSIIKGNIMSIFLRKNVFIDKILHDYSPEAIFPMHDFPVKTITSVNLVAWWADLQEKYYPEFFTRIQRWGRSIRTGLILKNCDNLVVSSQAVLDDFVKFYKLKDDHKINIFHFVSVIEDLETIKIDDLKTRYHLPDEYFIVSNQFHKHKNHRIILQSLAKLKEMGIRKHIAFTGKFPDVENSLYLKELRKIIDESNINDQVTFLGVISRSDQLQLMRYSQAVLQPSLFEGWSTVIEDAKSLQVPVVASNLKVNYEQLSDNGVYFDPHKPEELTHILKNYPKRNLNDVYYEDYSKRVTKAAKTLLRILICT